MTIKINTSEFSICFGTYFLFIVSQPDFFSITLHCATVQKNAGPDRVNEKYDSIHNSNRHLCNLENLYKSFIKGQLTSE